jgi:hypothetical protein
MYEEDAEDFVFSPTVDDDQTLLTPRRVEATTVTVDERVIPVLPTLPAISEESSQEDNTALDAAPEPESLPTTNNNPTLAELLSTTTVIGKAAAVIQAETDAKNDEKEKKKAAAAAIKKAAAAIRKEELTKKRDEAKAVKKAELATKKLERDKKKKEEAAKRKALKATKVAPRAVSKVVELVPESVVQSPAPKEITPSPKKRKSDTVSRDEDCEKAGKHLAINLIPECNPAYADRGFTLFGIKCSGSCGNPQVKPEGSKAVWLCKDLNSCKGATCTFALCNDCYNHNNVRVPRIRKQKTK